MPGAYNGPDGFFLLVNDLLTCVKDTLVAGGRVQPDRVCVVPGEIAWDNCECGQLVASIGRFYPSRNFPTEAGEDPTQQNCGPPLIVADVIVAIQRCAPEQTDCNTLAQVAHDAIFDAFYVRKGARCCLIAKKNSDDIVEFAVGGQTFTGPSGMCVGSDLTLRVALDAWCC